jgi:predicted nucleotidyltransferase
MRERVCQELYRIEVEHGVRVLLAVESGSRAWGFASPDSDYDVRFIYVHKRDWYLSVWEARDVIEEMLPDRLDVSGWDLRKTLRLFSKCNLALNEWLGSPIVYSEAPEFRTQFARLVPHYFNPIAALHHYRSMADRALVENLADGRIRIKSLFYVLRPLLACRWIEHTSMQPATEFQKLAAAEWVTADEKDWISVLLEQKSAALEAQPILLDDERIQMIRTELDHFKSTADLLRAPPHFDVSRLDAVLRDWIEEN